MILNHCCSMIRYIIILFCSLLFGKAFSPNEIELKENLFYEQNEREYFVLYKSNLNYEIEGPIRLELISRRAIPEKSKRKYEFGYEIFLNDTEPIEVRHKKYKKDNMFSNDHPGHGYTQSGNTVINLPDGLHKISIAPLFKGKPTLIRVINKLYKRSEGITEIVMPESMDGKSIVLDDFIINSYKRKYFKLVGGQLLSFNGISNDEFSLYGRTNTDSNQSKFNFYQFEILEGNRQTKVVIDYFENVKIDSKQKIYHFKSVKDNKYDLNLLDSNVPVFLRLIKNTPYE